MATLYVLDSSALVKRYHRETGTDLVKRLFEEPENLFLISILTLSEVARVLDRLCRRGYYSSGDIRLSMQRLHQDCRSGRIALMDVTKPIIFQANELIFRFHLTAADAVILATALTLAEQTPVFVCADTRSGLLRAAEACHLSTLNPLSP